MFFTVSLVNQGINPDNPSPARILLIEDNETSRQLMSDYLEYHGYQVHALADGISWTTAMQQVHPHLVLLDLKLPEIDGFAILNQLTQQPEWASIPVIIVSAFAFQADRKRALQLGAKRYFVKPVNLVQLRQAISEELGFPHG